MDENKKVVSLMPRITRIRMTVISTHGAPRLVLRALCMSVHIILLMLTIRIIEPESRYCYLSHLTGEDIEV